MGAMTASTPTQDHPRTRPMESWPGRKAVLASRGEVDGPRVAECDAALAWWRIRSRLVSEMGITEERAESLLETDRSAAQHGAGRCCGTPNAGARRGRRGRTCRGSGSVIAMRDPTTPQLSPPVERPTRHEAGREDRRRRRQHMPVVNTGKFSAICGWRKYEARAGERQEQAFVLSRN